MIGKYILFECRSQYYMGCFIYNLFPFIIGLNEIFDKAISWYERMVLALLLNQLPCYNYHMNRKNKRKLPNTKILVAGFLFFLLVLVNILTIMWTEMDQFNVFHRYDKTYSVMDWNLPHIVSEQIDQDDKVDTVMYTGCVFLTTVPAINIPTNKQCKNNIVGNGETIGIQMPILYKKLINTYVAQKDDLWEIVVHYAGETKLYKITSGGELLEEKTPITLKLDSLLYSLSHLYTFIL